MRNGICSRSVFAIKLLNCVVGGHSSFGCNITEPSINYALSGVNGHLQRSFLWRTGTEKCLKMHCLPWRLMLCALTEPGFQLRSRRGAKIEALESTHINAVGQKRGPVSIKHLGASQQLHITISITKHTAKLI